MYVLNLLILKMYMELFCILIYIIVDYKIIRASIIWYMILPPPKKKIKSFNCTTITIINKNSSAPILAGTIEKRSSGYRRQCISKNNINISNILYDVYYDRQCSIYIIRDWKKV